MAHIHLGYLEAHRRNMEKTPENDFWIEGTRGRIQELWVELMSSETELLESVSDAKPLEAEYLTVNIAH